MTERGIDAAGTGDEAGSRPSRAATSVARGLILLLAMLAPAVASALSCVYVLEENGLLRQENPERHDAVFVGEVLDVELAVDREACEEAARQCARRECVERYERCELGRIPYGPHVLVTYRFAVSRFWAEPPRDGVLEISAVRQIGEGAHVFLEGRTYLVFANRDADGLLRSGQCSSWARELEQAGDMLQRVERMLGPGTAVEPRLAR